MAPVRSCSHPAGETSMTVLVLTLTTLALVLPALAPLLATGVALLARNPARRTDARSTDARRTDARRTDARRVLRLLLTRPSRAVRAVPRSARPGRAGVRPRRLR